ncbi:MAG TPA: succinate dehydrogenase, hydrophobic membrane anchor protein [Burkholderiales bacterium]|nr:succinate dehydrogenase, hydrophobic membrane anchor protein [Burkholderiales bacterium]
MVKRVVVGAHYGLSSWLIQRLTAVVMALYTVLLVAILIIAPPRHFGAWKALFSNQGMKLATFLFLVSMFAHAWVGMRDILMDYVKPTGWRLGLEAVVLLALIAYTGWTLQILWSA